MQLFGTIALIVRRSAMTMMCAAWPAVASLPAWAEDSGAPAAAPRIAITIDDTSIVLIAANDQIYAYVDRISDNAPAEATMLRLARRGIDTPLRLAPSATGFFVAPFRHAGRPSDTFTVTLTTRAGDVRTGTAELLYGDTALAAMPEEPASWGAGRVASLALAGCAVAACLMLAVRNRGRRWRSGGKQVA